MAKLKKSTKKFVKNNLDRTIKDRKTRQKKITQVQRANQAKKATALKSASKKGVATQDTADASSDGGDGSEREEEEKGKSGRMGVDDFMKGGFLDGMGEHATDDDDEEEEEDAEDDDESLQDIEDLSDEEEEHAQDLAKLAKKDPEFFKYLQENDKDLLEFGQDDEEEDEEAEVAIESTKQKGKKKAVEKDAEVVTSQMLRGWQKSILQTHSLKAFRRLLLAFRAAAHMGEEDAEDSGQAYLVNDAAVFNKLIMTALKYVPVVLQHHIPCKELPNGRFKLPTNSRKFGALQKSVQSFASSLHRLLKTLPEPQLLYVCVSESSKIIPFLMQSRRMSREYVKVLLNLWSTAEESVRIAAFLCVRRVAAAGDEAMLDLCLKGAYHAIVRNTKTTTIHNIDSINLMKNSATELFSLNLVSSYQQAFGFIRQLAIHLRNCLKTRTPESYQAVYNWQYVHCIDFWSIVLSTTCDKEREEESTMQPLIYPLVQAATGAVRLIPTSRYFPLRFHIVQSMLRLMQRTGTYIPLAPILLEILESPEFTRKAKPSTLVTLDFQTLIRVPKAYVRTKVYADQLADESLFYLLEFLHLFSRDIAFPELVVPVIVTLKRVVKTSRSSRDTTNAKVIGAVKNLLDKVERQSQYIVTKRANVDFAPADIAKVSAFLLHSQDKSELPLESAMRLARKVRSERRALLQQQTQMIVDEA